MEDDKIVKNTENQKKNTLGLVGFIVSIVSIFTVGLLSVPALIISIIGLNESKKCDNDKKGLSIAGIIISAVMLCVFSTIVVNTDTAEDNSNDSTQPKTEEKKKSSETVLTESQKMLIKITALMKEDLAFDTGNYIQGDIPAGEYAFVKFSGSGSYYCEKDASGSIIDNENFDSFGYVYVHAAGNLETRGVLINTSAFEKLGVTGAKQIYEILNGQNNWNQSGYYKVGTDIAQGSYTLESIGSGYYSIMSGPVGKSEIVDNDIFDGRASVNVTAGQYLNLSRAKFTQ